MIAEWDHWKAPLSGGSGAEFQVRLLINFLGTCGDLEALQKLASRLGELPTSLQIFVFEAPMRIDFFLVNADDNRISKPPEIDALAEELAVHALENRQSIPSRTIVHGQLAIHDLRVCDIAADALATRWPKRYTFTGAATHEERDLEIIRSRNVWRAAHNLPALPAAQ